MSDRLAYETWNDEKVSTIIQEQRDYFDLLRWAYNNYGNSIVYACSFGAEGIVLVDLISKVKKDAEIIFLDTGLHFPETYELIEKIRMLYPSLQINMLKSKLSLEAQAKWYGDELWKENPNLCCHLRKIVPLQEVLAERKAWISGLRREQSPTRKNIQFINKDEKFHNIKICPLIHWTWKDVWNYIHLNNLPYNPLHDKSYPSIGCSVCTQSVSDSDDSRAGRWAGHLKTECGLHVNPASVEK